jgi:protein phosphatase
VIRTERAHLHTAAITHPGLRRENNEDRYAVSAHWVDSEEDHPYEGLPSVLAVVSDGIGGHKAGEVASELAVETISQVVIESDAWKPTAILNQAVIQTNELIAEQAEADPAQEGMGATCVCTWVIGDSLYAVSVGDSRIYLIRGDQIRQLTTDHTWVQEAIEHGALTPEQAQDHPNAHVIRRYLGTYESINPDFRLRLQADETDRQAKANQGMKLVPGDRLVLCTDGLTDLVSDDEILRIVNTHPRDEALKELVDLANERGGHDNITIVMLKVPSGDADLQKTIPIPKRRDWRKYLITLGILALVAMVIAVVSGLAWYLTKSPSSTLTATPTTLQTNTSVPGLPHGQATATPSITNSPSPLPTSPQVTYTPWPTNTPASISAAQGNSPFIYLPNGGY